jgi:hypothetical protein
MMNLLHRIKAYAGALPVLMDWTLTSHVVPFELAQARADVCTGRLTGRRCPLNEPDWQVTETISAAFRRHVELKNKLDLRTQGEKKLLFCQACACPLKTKIWLPLGEIAPTAEERDKFDPQCWLLSEQP